jgi:transposase
MKIIQAQSREGSLYYTDEWQAYAILRMRGDHVVIRKEKGCPVGRDHINGIEGFWSYAKNWLYPIAVCPKSSSIFISAKPATGSTTGMRTSNLSLSNS